jgi:hypothetical protein
LDISILNHKRTRELFRDYEKPNIKIKYCGQPNFEALQEFIVKKNIRMDINGLYKSFVHNMIIIEDDDEENKENEEKE